MPDHAHHEVVARSLRIHGRVQGVSYRASAQIEAQRLGLSGWVRNRSDGSVEALVAGRQDAIDRFIDWARRGPPAARVDRIDARAAEAPPHGPFGVRPTL